MADIDTIFNMPPGLRGALISLYDGDVRSGDELSIQLLARKYPQFVKISGRWAKITTKGKSAMSAYLRYY